MILHILSAVHWMAPPSPAAGHHVSPCEKPHPQTPPRWPLAAPDRHRPPSPRSARLPPRPPTPHRSRHPHDARYAPVWYKRLLAQKFDGRKHCGKLGRHRVTVEIEQLVIRMAEEHATWRYRRIQRAFANLGCEHSIDTMKH